MSGKVLAQPSEAGLRPGHGEQAAHPEVLHTVEHETLAHWPVSPTAEEPAQCHVLAVPVRMRPGRGSTVSGTAHKLKR